MDLGEMPDDDLWEQGSQRLRVDLLVIGEADQYTKYRSALTRHKDNLYADFVRCVAGNSTYIVVENGVVKSFKYQLATPRAAQLEVFRDGLIVHTNTSLKIKEFERSMLLQHPIFVMAFIISPKPCDLPLGMYVVEAPITADKKSWKLRRHEDLYIWPSVPSVDAGENATVEEGRPTVPEDVPADGSRWQQASPPLEAAAPTQVPGGDASVDGSRWQHACPLPAAPTPSLGDTTRRPPALRSGSLRFTHNGDDFDSMLECIHREAFRRMGLRYLVTRNSFQIGHLLSEQTQRMYTTDGILYAAVGSPIGQLQVFHVEIKPGPLTVEEGERCRALCQFLNQNVLCVCGGHVSDSQLSSEGVASLSGVDYAQFQRCRPCMEMCLYAPQGIDAAPLLYPTVMWSYGDGCSAPFLSMLDHSNPRRKEDARLRLLHVYHQATKDATKFSRRPEPY